MAQSEIHVSTEALEHFQHALKRFRPFLLEHLRNVQGEIRQIREHLEERCREAEGEVDDCQSAIDRADDDDDLDDLRRSLSDAEETLRNAKQARRQHERLVTAFQREANQLTYIAEDELPRAETFVERKRQKLTDYVNVGGGGGFSGRGASSGTGMGGHASPLGAAAAILTAGVNPDLVDLASQLLPRGVQWMDLGMIDLADGLKDVRGPADFRSHASYDVMKDGFDKLRNKILPEIARRGYAADGFYFSRLDLAAGVSYEHGLQRVYEAFFGGDPITVDYDAQTGKYSFINGRHRTKVALDSGWPCVPVKIVGRQHP